MEVDRQCEEKRVEEDKLVKEKRMAKELEMARLAEEKRIEEKEQASRIADETRCAQELARVAEETRIEVEKEQALLAEEKRLAQERGEFVEQEQLAMLDHESSKRASEKPDTPKLASEKPKAPLSILRNKEVSEQKRKGEFHLGKTGPRLDGRPKSHQSWADVVKSNPPKSASNMSPPPINE